MQGILRLLEMSTVEGRGLDTFVAEESFPSLVAFTLEALSTAAVAASGKSSAHIA